MTRASWEGFSSDRPSTTRTSWEGLFSSLSSSFGFWNVLSSKGSPSNLDSWVAFSIGRWPRTSLFPKDFSSSGHASFISWDALSSEGPSLTFRTWEDSVIPTLLAFTDVWSSSLNSKSSAALSSSISSYPFWDDLVPFSPALVKFGESTSQFLLVLSPKRSTLISLLSWDDLAVISFIDFSPEYSSSTVSEELPISDWLFSCLIMGSSVFLKFGELLTLSSTVFPSVSLSCFAISSFPDLTFPSFFFSFWIISWLLDSETFSSFSFALTGCSKVLKCCTSVFLSTLFFLSSGFWTAVIVIWLFLLFSTITLSTVGPKETFRFWSTFWILSKFLPSRGDSAINLGSVTSRASARAESRSGKSLSESSSVVSSSDSEVRLRDLTFSRSIISWMVASEKHFSTKLCIPPSSSTLFLFSTLAALLEKLILGSTILSMLL